MREIRQIIIHCSDTPAAMDIGAAEIRRWHVQERQWADIGYHAVIRRDGRVEPGRPMRLPGAHCRGYNRYSAGICLIGGRGPDESPEANFTPGQYAALEGRIQSLLKANPKAEVMGHHDLDPGKACPCFDAAAWWRGCQSARGKR